MGWTPLVELEREKQSIDVHLKTFIAPVESKYQSIPCVSKILIPYSRFSRIDQTELDDFPTCAFSLLRFPIFRFSK